MRIATGLWFAALYGMAVGAWGASNVADGVVIAFAFFPIFLISVALIVGPVRAAMTGGGA